MVQRDVNEVARGFRFVKPARRLGPFDGSERKHRIQLHSIVVQLESTDEPPRVKITFRLHEDLHRFGLTSAHS